MPRPTLPARLSSRLKSSNGTTSAPNDYNGRNGSPRLSAMTENRHGTLTLRTAVLKGRDLAAKDKSGTSDPYIVLTLGDAKESTPVISKTLNPEWNQTVEMPIVGSHSMLLEVVCWDKDRFGKDYMGEFDVGLDELFGSGQVSHEPKWYPLESRKTGRKKSVVTGEVLLGFSLIDPSNASASPQEILQKLSLIATSSPTIDEDESLSRIDSGELEDEEEEETSDETDDSKKPETVEKRRRRMRLKRLKKRATLRGYEFSGTSDVAGVLFLEVIKITDLPPEKNMTRTSFDCDPFVVTSLGKKTYRTRVIRHNLNPVFEEKLVFQVLRNEVNYSLNFAVVDKDKLSNNDFIGTINFPLEKVVSVCPEADSSTGLFHLPEPDGNSTPPETRRSRFRLPMSRSSSASSLHKLVSRPNLKKENSAGSLSSTPMAEPALPPPPTSAPMEPASGNGSHLGVPAINVDPHNVDNGEFRTWELPLELKNKVRWESKHYPVLHIRAKYLPYKALRQQFWRAMLKQYDADDSGRIDKVELTTMLDSLGSTLHESTIDGFFQRFSAENNGDGTLSFDQAVICLEDQLQRTEKKTVASAFKDYIPSSLSGSATDFEATPGSVTPSADEEGTPLNCRSAVNVVPAIEQDTLGKDGEEGLALKDDLAEERDEEHVVEIRECPICHQPRLNKRTDADIVSHVATCASQDWRQVNNIVMGGFVTSSQAQRKWYSKVITKISYGGYRLGANSANILVQDRITGQINEERMSVYVRLGIRLLYKGFKSRMEADRIRKLLRSLSVKQGKKYDDPSSAAEIPGFINFHQLDMSEVLLPIEQFKTFNEFFYRALKPGARPCSAPDRPEIVTSPADCRSVVFNRLEEAQTVWVKGREFSVERLLGKAYPQDAKRYNNGALGIFRLAPQDYHRFHIPVDGVMGEPKLIEGEYYTVNPMAIRSALDVYGENVRICVPIDSVKHGRVMVICVGAMMVGSTVITRKAGEKVARAEELGYFKFGGSTLLVLFEPGVMQWDDDLVTNSSTALETLIRVGMSVGHSPDQAPYTPDMRKENPTKEEKQEAKRRIEGSLAPASGKHLSAAATAM
ncbi:phosphatidylserine decarboxylase proenzyme [Lineolata rhizophorae]|uniref:Phosphatidylserine decarboxylase proenzyme 2 n=1 Tax=Lineolata rhizophorae TaxID=578093 RepID=A0A6A6NQ27_9PEZI|nr:phosphatidylserine decarboxylase proenzyme [Lineolata rhizophorae]